MDIENLKVFVDVVRQGSFSEVARRRQVSPSSISRTISTLEQELGVRLFQRSTRCLLPTEAGTNYFERIEPLVEELESASQTIQEQTQQARGVVRLTASPSFGISCIAPRLAEFSERHPELSVELTLSDKRVDLMADGIDLAIRQGSLEDSSLVSTRFITSGFRVCASPTYLKAMGHPNTPEALEQHRCMSFPFPGYQSTWRFKPLMAKRDDNTAMITVPINSHMVINNGLALKQCAIDGAGIVLLSDWLVADAIADGQLINLFPDLQATASEFEARMSFVYPSKSYVPEKVRIVMAFLREACNEYQLKN